MKKMPKYFYAFVAIIIMIIANSGFAFSNEGEYPKPAMLYPYVNSSNKVEYPYTSVNPYDPAGIHWEDVLRLTSRGSVNNYGCIGENYKKHDFVASLYLKIGDNYEFGSPLLDTLLNNDNDSIVIKYNVVWKCRYDISGVTFTKNSRLLVKIAKTGIIHFNVDTLKGSYNFGDNVDISVSSCTIDSIFTPNILPGYKFNVTQNIVLGLSLDIKTRLSPKGNEDIIYVNYNIPENTPLQNPLYYFTDYILSSNLQPVRLSWELNEECTLDSIPMYQVQILKIYNYDPILEYGTLGNYKLPTSLAIDWKKAVTLYTSNYKRYIDVPLTEGEGYYVWRVRPIGNLYPNGPADDRNWGEWAKMNVDGTLTPYPYIESGLYTNEGAYFLLFYDRNPQSDNIWLHNRTFTDDINGGTKQFDQIDHLDNLLKVRQAQVRKVSDNSTIVAQSYYDYLGRNTITPLPYPERDLILPEGSDPNTEKTTGLNYKFTNIPYDSFSPYVYDPDSRFQEKVVLSPLMTGRLIEFYDGNYNYSNFPEIDSKKMKIPSAEGYPFIKNSFKEDGTNRILESTILGKASINNTVTPNQYRSTKYFYSTVTRDELFGILNDQTPKETELTKTYVKDPNGVVTITYYDPDNKPLATCIDKTSATDVLDTLNHQYVNFSQKDISYIIDRYSAKTPTIFSDSKVFVDTKDFETHTLKFEDNLDSLQVGNSIGISCMGINLPFYIPYTVRLSVTDDLTLNSQKTAKANFLPTTFIGDSYEITHSALNTQYTTHIGSMNNLLEGSYTAKREVEFYRDAALSSVMPNINSMIDTYLDQGFEDIRNYIASFVKDGHIEMNDVELAKFYKLLDKDTLWFKYPSNSSLDSHNVDYYYKTLACGDIIRVPYNYCGVKCELPTDDYEQYLKDVWGPHLDTIKTSLINAQYPIDVKNIDSYFYYHDKSTKKEEQLYNGHSFNGQGNANGAFNLLIHNMLNDTTTYHDDVKYKYSKDTVCDCWKKTVDIGLEMAFTQDEVTGQWRPSPYYDLLNEFLDCTGRKISGFAPPCNPYEHIVSDSVSFFKDVKFGYGYLAYAYRSFEYDAFTDFDDDVYRDNVNYNYMSCEKSLNYKNYILNKPVLEDTVITYKLAVYPYIYNLDYLKWSEFYLCQRGETTRGNVLAIINKNKTSENEAKTEFNNKGFYAADKSQMPECFSQAIQTGNIIDPSCVTEYKNVLEAKCHLKCDSLGFRQRLVNQIHEEGGYIEDEPYCQGYEIDVNSIQFLPPGTPRKVQMNALGGEVVELSINKYFTLSELSNYVSVLEANCDCNCNLTQGTPNPPASSSNPYANLAALGTQLEWKNMKKAMTWDYDLRIRKLYNSDTLSASRCVDDSLYSCGPDLEINYTSAPFDNSDWEWEKLIGDPSGNGLVSEEAILNYLALRLNRRLDTIKVHLANFSYTDAYLFADSSLRKNNCFELKSEYLSAVSALTGNVYNLSFPYSATIDYTQGIIYRQTESGDLKIPFINPIANSLGGILYTTARGLSYDFKNTTGLHVDVGDSIGIRNDEWTFFPRGRFLKVYGKNVNSECDLDTLLMKYDDKFIVERDSNGHYALYLERTWTYDDNQDTASVIFAPYRSKLKFLKGSIGMDLCSSLCYRWKPLITTDPRHDILTCGGNYFNDVILTVGRQYDEFKGKYRKLACNQADSIFTKLIEDAKKTSYGRFTINKIIAYTAYTLYYYDRGGNLQYTVPPEGVRLNAAGRHHFVSNEIHTMAGKLLSKQTPEEETGREIFIYDKYNRLRFSQNAKQRPGKLFTYIKYDRLGRIIENGEIIDSQDSLLPSRLDNYKFYSDNWPNDGTLRTGYVRNAYDMPCESRYNNQLDGVELTSDYKQRNVRNKLSYATRYNPITPGVAQPSAVGGASMWRPVTTVYSYDPMGHVEFVLQLISRDPVVTNSYNNTYVASNGFTYNPKYVTGSMHYQYDYVSGNINMIIYNKYNASDEDLSIAPGLDANTAKSKITTRSKFYEKFEYDEDNRLVAVFTSRDSIIWEKDARYEFYPHGPIFKGEIGTDGLAINEYTYTLEGWQKSLNGHPSFAPGNELTSDGIKTAIRPFGYVLNYYSDDFKHSDSRGMPQSISKDLFNGSIRSAEFSFKTYSANSKLNRVSSVKPARFTYDYDLLYRLTKSTFSKALDLANWGAETDNFKTTLRYDLNGNILNQTNSSYNGTLMNNFRYRSGYTARADSEATNKLLNVYQLPSTPKFTYAYDKIGNLTSEIDNMSGGLTTNIVWTYDNKLSKINRPFKIAYAACNLPILNTTVTIQYLYDASGNRVAEIMNDSAAVAMINQTTNCQTCMKALGLKNKYYIRRENGDIMSVYETELLSYGDVPLNYRFPELPGLKNNNVITRGGGPSACLSESVLRQVEWDIYAGAKDGMLATATPDTMTQIQHFYRPLGWKTYEMKDWLGTPRLTFSDIKQPDVVNMPYADYTYHLDYLSATTTYPFGARIDSLSFESPSYRFGFTGHLKDNNIRPDKGDGANYSTLFREYDAIIGRWWSIDPLRAKYAGMSPYNYAAGNPISIIDPLGSKIYIKNSNGDYVEYRKDHKVYTLDGKRYKNKDEYVKGVIKTLRIIEKASNKTNEIINSLVTSDFIHKIEPTTEIFHHQPSNYAEDEDKAFKHIPTGSTTYFDPVPKVVDGSVVKPEWILGHELAGHGNDTDEGKLNYLSLRSGVAFYDVNAVNIENEIRPEAEKRTFYKIEGDIPKEFIRKTEKEIKREAKTKKK